MYPLYAELMELEGYSTERKNYTKTFKDRLTKACTDISKESNPVPTVQTQDVTETTPVNKQSIYFQESKFPEFSGGRRDYTHFQKEWRQCVSPNYDQVFKLREITKRVPKKLNLTTDIKQRHNHGGGMGDTGSQVRPCCGYKC